jgi:DNA gyrase inhibitor GyrI
MTFEEYLVSKNIDSYQFRSSAPAIWQEWQQLFEQMHPNSFNEQKKFLINEIRRKYLLQPDHQTVQASKSEVPSPRKGPVIRKKTD